MFIAKTKTKKFNDIFLRIFKILWGQLFEILSIHNPSLGSCEFKQNLGNIGSVGLMFIGYK